MRQKLRIRWKALKMEIKEHKSSFVVYMVLRALVILVMILQILNRNLLCIDFIAVDCSELSPSRVKD